MKLFFSFVILFISVQAKPHILINYDQDTRTFRFVKSYLEKRLPPGILKLEQKERPCNFDYKDFHFFACIENENMKILKKTKLLATAYGEFFNE